MKFKIILALLILTILIFFVPKYLFSYFEQSSNNLFATIEEGRDKEDYKKVKVLLLTHKSILNNQKKTVYFLPKKYAEYFKLKQDLYNKYYSALDKFVILKTHEDGLKEILTKKEEFNKLLSNSKDQKANAMDVYLALNDYLSQKDFLKKYLDDGFITQDLYDGFIKDFEKSTEIYNLLNDVAENKLKIDDLITIMDEINFKYKTNDLNRLIQDSYNLINIIKQKEWVDINMTADQDFYLVYDFYLKNNLGKNDFSKKYESIKVDLNGDGLDEVLVLTNTLIAYDKDNKEIARLPSYLSIPKPIAGSAKVFTPKNDNKNQFVIYDFDLGGNTIKSMLFGLLELKTGGFGVLPICSKEKPESINDCYFFKDEIKL